MRGGNFLNNTLKTFSNSSVQGRSNSEMDILMNEFKEETQPILDKFVKKCVLKNIEYCSLNGALYEEFSSMILSARKQTMLDLSEEEKGTIII